MPSRNPGADFRLSRAAESISGMLLGKRITLVVAMARNRAIGKDGRLPWHLPRELRHFKETTMGKAMVMGRFTYLSIGRALPGRQNIVITRNPAFRAEGCDLAGSLEQAIEIARSEEVMVIGGGQLYAEAMPYADRMVITEVDCEPDADTWFPRWAEDQWLARVLRSEVSDDTNPFDYRVIELVRRTNP